MNLKHLKNILNTYSDSELEKIRRIIYERIAKKVIWNKDAI